MEGVLVAVVDVVGAVVGDAVVGDAVVAAAALRLARAVAGGVLAGCDACCGGHAGSNRSRVQHRPRARAFGQSVFPRPLATRSWNRP